MNDTTRRFLSEVLAQVGEERIVEMRLFPAIRQGGIESAVAVLAVDPRPVLSAVTMSDGETALSAPTTPDDGESVLMETDPTHALPRRADDVGDGESVLMETESTNALPSRDDYVGDEAPPETEADPAIVLADRVAELRVTFDAPSVARTDAADADSPYAVPGARGEREVPLRSTAGDTPSSIVEPEDALVLGDILALPAPESNPRAPRREHPTRDRLEIHSARYVFVYKGPERGTWTVDVVHEADAPLETLERVVLGVARRAGDTSETEMYTGESLRHALDQPVWA